MSLSEDLISWIKNQVKEAGKEGVVLGLSGGLDSACVAVLCKKALGDNVLGLIMPCESNLEDEKFVNLLTEGFNIKTETVTLDAAYNELTGILPPAGKMAKANLKPRLRMMVLYYFANKLNCLVAGTGNKSELTVGYFTKYGDGGVDILPLGNLLKTEVKKLAEELGIHGDIIERTPTAGLWEGQTDEGELGMSYEELDEAIISMENAGKPAVNQEIIDKVRMLSKKSEHKRLPVSVFEKKEGESNGC